MDWGGLRRQNVKEMIGKVKILGYGTYDVIILPVAWIGVGCGGQNAREMIGKARILGLRLVGA